MEFADYDENRLLLMQKKEKEKEDEHFVINRFVLISALQIFSFIFHMNVLLSIDSQARNGASYNY